jgi:hypothetical protein
VNDVIGVTVVDALKDLFHEDGGILLRKLSSCNDLIEQLTSLANPIGEIVTVSRMHVKAFKLRTFEVCLSSIK